MIYSSWEREIGHGRREVLIRQPQLTRNIRCGHNKRVTRLANIDAIAWAP